jgi:hypothetical protein
MPTPTPDLAATPGPTAAATAAGPGGDGLTWGNAFDQLQDGIDAAADEADVCEFCEVWVVQGTYYVYEDNVHDTVALGPGVGLFGGFAGDETSLDERDPDPALTILDGRPSASGTERVRHVVTGADGAAIDGFTITNGSATADIDEDPYREGAGLLAVDPDGMLLRNCTVSGNQGYEGGGVSAIDGGEYGGVLIRDCTIAGNTSVTGGGIHIKNTWTYIINSVISSNAADQGGGLWITGSQVEIVGTTVHGNSGFDASAMLIAYSTVNISSSICWYNPLSTPGNVIEQSFSDVEIGYSVFQGGAAGPGNVNADPLFTDADNADYHLLPGSPAIDAADATLLPEVDIEGQARVDDPDTPDTGIGDPPYADMGAYEYQPE